MQECKHRQLVTTQVEKHHGQSRAPAVPRAWQASNKTFNNIATLDWIADCGGNECSQFWTFASVCCDKGLDNQALFAVLSFHIKSDEELYSAIFWQHIQKNRFRRSSWDGTVVKRVKSFSLGHITFPWKFNPWLHGVLTFLVAPLKEMLLNNYI